MLLFQRVKRLEDEMFQRKIDEKIEEYEKKYKRKFEFDIDAFGCFRLIMAGNEVANLYAQYNQKEKLYNNLCECEDKIKVYLFDEMWGKENACTD